MWLGVDGLQGYVLGRPAGNATDYRRAASRYTELVVAAVGVPLWGSALRQQTYLGDEVPVERMRALAEPDLPARVRSPKRGGEKVSVLPAHWLSSCASREEVLYMAYTESGLTMSAIAAKMGLSVPRVSRWIARAEGKTRVSSHWGWAAAPTAGGPREGERQAGGDPEGLERLFR